MNIITSYQAKDKSSKVRKRTNSYFASLNLKFCMDKEHTLFEMMTQQLSFEYKINQKFIELSCNSCFSVTICLTTKYSSNVIICTSIYNLYEIPVRGFVYGRKEKNSNTFSCFKLLSWAPTVFNGTTVVFRDKYKFGSFSTSSKKSAQPARIYSRAQK